MSKGGLIGMAVLEGIKPGDRVRLTRSFGSQDVLAFGRISRDLNPYHFDASFAEVSRFGRPIVHGLLIGSMITEIGGQWAWLATKMQFSFKAPVFPGDTITLDLLVTEKDTKGFTQAEGRWTNQDGEVVMTGILEGYPPRAGEGRLLEEGARRGEV